MKHHHWTSLVRHVESLPGAYIIRNGEECLYVGCSSNVFSRLSSHALRGLGNQHPNLTITVLYTFGVVGAFEAESDLITKCKPTLNVLRPKQPCRCSAVIRRVVTYRAIKEKA